MAAESLQPYQTFPSDYKGSYLYRNFFASSKQHDYDTRIDDYNWYLIFGSQLTFYFVLNAVLRKTIPPPGKIEEFKARNKMRDYHTYYLQFISLFHALMACLFDPLILYWGGYRYNQPNHLLHKFMISHAFAYFLADSILEIAYGTDDMLMNCHHVASVLVSYFSFRAPHSGFEYL